MPVNAVLLRLYYLLQINVSHVQLQLREEQGMLIVMEIAVNVRMENYGLQPKDVPARPHK